MDKAFWLDIIENDYAVPEGYDLFELTKELLSYLQSADPELREVIAYSTLARWIVRDGRYEPADLRDLTAWLVPNVYAALGEEEADGVFLRSYCVLILSLIVYRDNQIEYMEEPEIATLLDTATEYLLRERDLRGQVPEKGLANGCSHAADLLRFIARSRHANETDLMRILDTIADKLLLDVAHIYQFDEDERLALVVTEIMKRDMLTIYNYSEWLNRLDGWKSAQPDDAPFDPVNHSIYVNVKNLLRALYCRIDLLGGQLPAQAGHFRLDLLESIRKFSV